jgi:hypothetical protein
MARVLIFRLTAPQLLLQSPGMIVYMLVSFKILTQSIQTAYSLIPCEIIKPGMCMINHIKLVSSLNWSREVDASAVFLANLEFDLNSVHEMHPTQMLVMPTLLIVILTLISKQHHKRTVIHQLCSPAASLPATLDCLSMLTPCAT